MDAYGRHFVRFADFPHIHGYAPSSDMLMEGVLLHVHTSHTRELLRALVGLILAPALAAAQATSSLPSAPQPQPQQQLTPQSIPPAPSENASIVTMAPHHGNDRYWLSGQANIIFQGNLPFQDQKSVVYGK